MTALKTYKGLLVQHVYTEQQLTQTRGSTCDIINMYVRKNSLRGSSIIKHMIELALIVPDQSDLSNTTTENMTTFNYILRVVCTSKRTGSGCSGKTFHIAHAICACIVEEYSQGYLEGTRVLNVVRFHKNKRSFQPSHTSIRNCRYDWITLLPDFPGVSWRISQDSATNTVYCLLRENYTLRLSFLFYCFFLIISFISSYESEVTSILN
jgi:hypothetical protein